MENKGEQYYPTYKAANRDILLAEFEEANKIANSQTKMYGQMASILLAGVTLLIPLFFEDNKVKVTQILVTLQANKMIFSTIIFLFGGLLLRYFVDLQKQITINGKKVVTLRVLLGLDYGSIHLTLPNWRVEGATNPFAIKYFNGWFNFKSSPFWVLTIGVNVIWWLSIRNNSDIYLLNSFYVSLYWVNIFITTIYLYIFRTNLNDRHETNWLNIKKIISKYILGINVVSNFEYILYRAKLAYIELDRLGIDYTNIKNTLIEIEDKTFYKNKGVSTKSLLRSFLSQFKFFRNKYNYISSGGSTITMQLARTLFIPVTSRKVKRKVVEILLARWLNKQFSKDEILKLYIANVQFEKKVIGMASAIKYFFSKNLKNKKLSGEESLFLVERLSNISSTVRWNRIKFLVSKITTPIDFEKLESIYNVQIKEGRLKE